VLRKTEGKAQKSTSADASKSSEEFLDAKAQMARQRQMDAILEAQRLASEVRKFD